MADDKIPNKGWFLRRRQKQYELYHDGKLMPYVVAASVAIDGEDQMTYLQLTIMGTDDAPVRADLD